jgi:hypothetical protein
MAVAAVMGTPAVAAAKSATMPALLAVAVRRPPIMAVAVVLLSRPVRRRAAGALVGRGDRHAD